MRHLALLSIAYLMLMLLVTAPASLLDPLVRRISHEKLSLANTRGTIWQGSATPVLHVGENREIALHTLNWKIRLLSLLSGRLGAELGWDGQKSEPAMALSLNSKGVMLTDARLPLPAEMIGELSPLLKPAQFYGDLDIQSRQLAFADHRLQGSASVRWNQAGSALSSVNPLGNYQIDIVAVQDELNAVLTTRDGALLLEGRGSWSAAQGLHFSGTARAAPDAESTLAELLQHLGHQTTPGTSLISI